MGNPGAPNYGQYGANASELITGQGNVNAAGQVTGANAYNDALGSSARDALTAYLASHK